MTFVFGSSYLIGYSALRARQFEMETISDNLANINTTGYKQRQAAFQSALAVGEGETVRAGVRLSGTILDFSQGTVQPTGHIWDLAIDGQGFFRVILPDGSIGYTRVGMFHPDAEGRLVNPQGYVLDPEIIVPEGAGYFNIDSWGLVSCTVDGVHQVLGEIQLARFPNAEGLLHAGEGIYFESEASGAPILANPTEEGMGQILAGALEMSNVDTAQQMIELMRTQRAYSLTLQALRITDQMAAITNQLEV